MKLIILVGDRAADLPQPSRYRGQGAQVGRAQEDRRGRRRLGKLPPEWSFKKTTQ